MQTYTHTHTPAAQCFGNAQIISALQTTHMHACMHTYTHKHTHTCMHAAQRFGNAHIVNKSNDQYRQRICRLTCTHAHLQLNVLGMLTSSVPQMTITDNAVCESKELRPFIIFRMGSRLRKFNGLDGKHVYMCACMHVCMHAYMHIFEHPSSCGHLLICVWV
jgi:hypothetical protein